MTEPDARTHAAPANRTDDHGGVDTIVVRQPDQCRCATYPLERLTLAASRDDIHIGNAIAHRGNRPCSAGYICLDNQDHGPGLAALELDGYLARDPSHLAR